MRTVHSIIVIATAACSTNHEQPHQRPASTTHRLEHASQSDLASELDDADRRGTWGDVRHRWQGQDIEWTVTRHRVLCRDEAECHVAAFPITHGAQRGWLPAVAFAPGEFGKLEAACGTAEHCDVVIAGTLAKLDATGDMPTSVKLANVRVVRRS
jgi:hypothetical protein